jgi:hypothetical protein
MYHYKFETHLHTSESSACGRDSGAEMIRACKTAGYSGAVITDHFFNGNCAVSRTGLSWEERVRLFVSGYENAKREGDEIGIDVYFGFEYNNHGAEFLVYNFSADKILAYPEIMTDDFEKVSNKIRGDGGFMVHAHPFRQAEYLRTPGRVFPELTDAVEVVNAAHKNNPRFDDEAKMYAEKYNLCKIGGSDTHWTGGIKSGVAFARKPESLTDMIDMIKQGEHIILGEKYDWH